MRRLVLLYMLLRFFEKYRCNMEGRKKVQKLMFLVEHYDLKTKTVKKSTGLTGYRFKIWSYGPFSKEIYDDLDQLVEDGSIEEEIISDIIRPDLSLYTDDGYPKRMYVYKPSRDPAEQLHGVLKDLDKNVIEKIDRIIDLFGDKSARDLEEFVNKILRLDVEKKINYWGEDVDTYLEREKISGN